MLQTLRTVHQPRCEDRCIVENSVVVDASLELVLCEEGMHETLVAAGLG